MTIASADLQKAIYNTWVAAGLDWAFKKYWSESDRSEFPALHDQEAFSGQPFPYCVFEQDEGTVVSRDSGHSQFEKHEIRDIPWVFQIHAKVVSHADESAKEIAARIAGFVMEKFGGHPTARPLPVTLENGSFLLSQYQSDIPIRTGDKEYQWNINYLFRVDVPVAV